MTTNTPFNPVLLSMIRQVMPTIVAQSIIGVQLMRGAGNLVGYARSRDKQGVKVTKQQYNEFLRLNNRKRTQSRAELDRAGYPSVVIDLPIDDLPYWGASYDQVDAWLTEQLGPHKFISIYSRYWFTNSNDAMVAKMGWL